MNESILSLKIADASREDLDQFEKEFKTLLGEENVEILGKHSFAGMDEIMAVLTIKDSVIIAELAGIIIMWLKTRPHKKVKIGDIDIAGYSKNEVIKIIEKLKTVNKIEQGKD